jgi:ankyrin repeat protein
VSVQLQWALLLHLYYRRFRWVFCQLETLRHCFPPSLRRILQELPESLDETYERILKNTHRATQAYAHRLLQCLMVAVRPLLLEELAELLAFDFDEAPIGIPKLNADWRREDQEQAVLSMCSSLISVVHDGGSRVVQFSHFSVKEFLTSDRLAVAVGHISFHHILLEPAHTILAQACLGVLLHLDDSPRETLVERFPLAEYSARHWVDHALFDGVSLRIKDGMLNLFDLDKLHFLQWIRIHDMDQSNWLDNVETHPACPDAAPVYYAALCGFRGVVEKLIGEHPNHVSARGGGCGTALHAASRMNHLKVVQSLLKHGADVNAQGQWLRTPLHIASRWGHLDVGRLLLEHGADVNAKQSKHITPLHLAAVCGHFELIPMVLGYNADIHAQDDSGRTPLHLAANNGKVDTARLLLDIGADLKARSKNQWTPLHTASYRGEIEVVRLLVERGMGVDAEDDEGKTAYQIALQEGWDDIAQLLSGHSAENKT